MLPCKYDGGNDNGGDKGKGHGDGGGKHDRRKLLSYAGDMIWHRDLAATDESPATNGASSCTGDKVALISTNGMHQLHIFIFVLAVLLVLYIVVTIALAQAKMKKWKVWELQTTSLEYKYTAEPFRFRFTHQTSFVRHHSGFSRTPGIRWIVVAITVFFLLSIAYYAFFASFLGKDIYEYMAIGVYSVLALSVLILYA
ncbi:hypothetical protein SLA2020_321700 [Shorea laevis]